MTMSMEPMEMIKQTGTTIIFEEFNKDRDDLVTLLTRNSEPISSEEFKNELMGPGSPFVVKNFQDFVAKFAPIVYESTYIQDGETRFRYTLENPGSDCRKINLTDHAFYKMVMSLLDRKAGTDKGNLEFPYDELKEALTPKAQLAEYKRLRQNLSSNWKRYLELTATGKPSAELDRFTDNVGNNLDKIVSNYVNDSPLGMLPLLIADTQAKIDSLKIGTDDQMGPTDDIQPCILELDGQGNLISTPLLPSSHEGNGENVILVDQAPPDGTHALAKQIRDDFQQLAPVRLRGNEYVQEMIVNVFAPVQSAKPIGSDQLPALQEAKKRNQRIYTDSLGSFAQAVTAVVEKLAGVRVFFDHATHKGMLPADVKVIITNCRADAIVNNSEAKEQFKNYFGRLSREKDVNRIWFGVLPGVAADLDQGMANNAEIPRSNFRRTAGGGRTATRKSAVAPVSQEATREMLGLLKDVRIMTFLSCKASAETGFIKLTAPRVDIYRKAFGDFNNDYAVFAYPNFTILPEERNTVEIGTELDEYNEREVSKFLRIPGIYLDAAYVATGMMVGIQNYRMLQDLGYKVNPLYPSVRFDLEDGDNAKRILTKLNRETTTEMDSNTKETILSDRFGFAFGDNKIVYDGHVLNQCYILNARTLRKKDGMYQSIYKTLVRDLVDLILRSLSDTVTKTSVDKFLREYVKTWITDSRDAARSYDNRILLKGETIKLNSEDPPQLTVRFNKGEEVWPEIEIRSEEAESIDDMEQ